MVPDSEQLMRPAIKRCPFGLPAIPFGPSPLAASRPSYNSQPAACTDLHSPPTKAVPLRRVRSRRYLAFTRYAGRKRTDSVAETPAATAAAEALVSTCIYSPAALPSGLGGAHPLRRRLLKTKGSPERFAHGEEDIDGGHGLRSVLLLRDGVRRVVPGRRDTGSLRHHPFACSTVAVTDR